MIKKPLGIFFLISALILILVGGYFGEAGWHNQPRPLEDITIGTTSIYMNGLLYVAKSQEFDRRQGLNLIIKPFEAGRDAIREVEANRLEFACCAEFVLVSETFNGAGYLRCLATISSGDVHELIARRDKGISKPENLRGKIIGVALGTSAEFYLVRFLSFNLIPRHEVTIVDVNPSDQTEAIAAGRVDAMLTWHPITTKIFRKLGAGAISWPAQEGQDFYWLLVSRKEVIGNRKETIIKLFGALEQAADFIKDQPEAAKAIIAQSIMGRNTDMQEMTIKYQLSLDQGLLLAMEDQARWLIHNKPGNWKKVPDFLNYIDASLLGQFNPQAVPMVIPNKHF